jgi:hypothetical protein
MPTKSDSPYDLARCAAPPDATQLHQWLQQSTTLHTRGFDGTLRETGGFAVQVRGLQRHNGTCRRWMTVDTQCGLGLPMEPEAARQLAGVLIAAADEIEARR